MKKSFLVLSIFLINISIDCAAAPGAHELFSGFDCLAETSVEVCGVKDLISELPVEPGHHVHPKCMAASGTITWSYEDWDGYYGAIADCVAVSGDGARIYVAWNLNAERISAFDAAGTGTPLWEYDVRAGSTYNISGSVIVRASDDGNLVVATVSNREPVGSTYYDSLLYRLDPATGSDVWTPIIMPRTIEKPDDSQAITHLEIASNGSIIAVATRGYRSDPIYESFFIYLYNPAGALLHTIEIPDPAGEILYINDIKITEQGNRMVADLRANTTDKQIVKVWDLTRFMEVQEMRFGGEGPQCTLGLSGNGDIFAIGNLRGILRVFKINDIMGKYVALWDYTIPPSYYYAWVKAIDISYDGGVLAVGSYQPDASASHGYLYVFDVDAGPPYTYKSSDFGDLVESVAVSDSGQIAVGAGWGPYSGAGYDLIVYDTVNDEEVFAMDGPTYPGSLFHCDISNSGKRLTAGGKRVHARAFGSGGWAYSIELDFDTGIPSLGYTGLCILLLGLTTLLVVVNITRRA